MHIETITEREDLLIRRMTLEPGEATPWHTDVCHRFTVVIRGSGLVIQFKDRAGPVDVDVHPGFAGWDAPEPRVHRAINPSGDVYEENVTFYRNGVDIDPQPEAT